MAVLTVAATAGATPRPNPEQLVGSCLVVGVEGKQLDKATIQALKTGRMAGIILLADNLDSPEQVQSLTASAMSAAKKGGFPPPLICVDQEGGKVNRMQELPDFPGQPAAASMAKKGPKEIQDNAAEIGKFMKSLGINLDFAPDLDLDRGTGIIGNRSFGLDPTKVVECGKAVIEGFHEAGICAVIKHFPGHGLTHADSHVGLPKVAPTSEKLERHMSTFEGVMSANPDGAMLAHLLVKNVDPKYPASLSQKFATQLRAIIGQDRLIFTDSGSMGALAKFGAEPARAGRAITAGADIYLTTTPYHLLKNFNKRVYAKIESHAMLLKAARRVNRWRSARLSQDPVPQNSIRG